MPIKQTFQHLLFSSLCKSRQTTQSITQHTTQDISQLPIFAPSIASAFQEESRYLPREVHRFEYCTQFDFYTLDIILPPPSRQSTKIKLVILHGPHCKKIKHYIIIIGILKDIICTLELVGNRHMEELIICLIPTKATKKFPKQAGIQTYLPQHVNSGVTFMKDLARSEIFVYRYEEMCKVLLHELLHAYRFDYHALSHTQHGEEFLKSLQYSYFPNGVHTTRLGLNEALNDFLTCVIYTGIFVKYDDPRNICSYKTFLPRFNKTLKQVQAYILATCAKILQYGKVQGTHTEETHVLSYYIGKAILFHNIANTLRWWITTGKNDAFSSQRIQEFEEMINNGFKHKSFQAKLRKTPIPKKSSMRMCNIEIPL